MHYEQVQSGCLSTLFNRTWCAQSECGRTRAEKASIRKTKERNWVGAAEQKRRVVWCTLIATSSAGGVACLRDAHNVVASRIV